MITFSRSQLVSAEFLENDVIRFNGIQEDHIYSMEVQLEVRVTDGEILSVKGDMKRYTNFVCPQAIPVLQTAVGLSLLEEGWDKKVMKEIGRKGCEHFAEIIIECGRCLKQAVLSNSLHDALSKDPSLDQTQFLMEMSA